MSPSGSFDYQSRPKAPVPGTSQIQVALPTFVEVDGEASTLHYQFNENDAVAPPQAKVSDP